MKTCPCPPCTRMRKLEASWKNKETWIIRDWTNKILWDGKQFDSFADAWDWIYEEDPIPPEESPHYDPHWYDDYYVEIYKEDK